MARSGSAADLHVRVPAEDADKQKNASVPVQDATTPTTPELRNRMGVNSPRLKNKEDRDPARTGSESQYEEEYDYGDDDDDEYYEQGYDGEAGATTVGYHQQQQQQGYSNGGGVQGLVTQVARPDPSSLVTQVARPDPNAKAVPRPPASHPSARRGKSSRPAKKMSSTHEETAKIDEDSHSPSKKRPLSGLARLCSCFMPTRGKKEMDDSEVDKHSPEAEMAHVDDVDHSSRRSSESSAGSFDGVEGDALLPPKSPENRHKKCLVLDLDETLVHSSFKPVPNPDFIVPITIDGNVHQVYVMKRPGVDEFMQKVCQKYEVILFTASLSKYANPLLDILDPANTLDYRLFREACVMHCGTYVKDLSLLGRKLRSTIIVDNSPQSYSFHPSNAVPIDSWFDDRSDRQLYDLLPLLSYLADVHDVRESLDANKPIDWLLHEFKQKEKAEQDHYAAQGQHQHMNGATH